MNLIIKGFIIGIGKIIPGVSGAMLAITLGIYDKIINALSNLTKELKKNIIFLIKICIGIAIAITLGSKIIVNCLNKNYFATMLLFIGMIIGDYTKYTKKIKENKIIPLLIITIIIIMIIINKKIIIKNYILKYTLLDFIKLIFIGNIDALSSIIPGISGTALLMMTGYYNTIINAFSSILYIRNIKQTIFIIIPFGIGFIFGIIIISKIIDKIMQKHKKKIDSIITIFMTITILNLMKNALQSNYTKYEFIIGILLFFLGISISKKLNQKT